MGQIIMVITINHCHLDIHSSSMENRQRSPPVLYRLLILGSVPLNVDKELIGSRVTLVGNRLLTEVLLCVEH